MRRYDLTAEIYEMRYAEEQIAKYNAALECLRIARHSILLDVGCGTGLLFRHVATQTKMVVGVDISRKLLRQAKDCARRFCSVHLIQADADHLPFKDAAFSVVFAFTVLQNMPKPLETLSEIKRNVKRDAPIVVTGLKKVFSLQAFRELLQRSGLQIISIKDADALECYVAVTVRSEIYSSCCGSSLFV
jgi:ubiquinone/menaquinone biosynthesis C-methylase UbiE